MKRQIEHCGITFDVVYEHSKPEKRTHEHPGCEEDLKLEQIFHKGIDFSEFITYEQQCNLEKQILNEISSHYED